MHEMRISNKKRLYIQIYIAIAILVCSCSPKTRFTRLIDKHPYLLTTDTVIIRDTVEVLVPSVEVDTVVEFSELYDTVFLEKEQLEVKVYVDREKKVYIEGKCDTITVQKFVERKIPVKYYERNYWYNKPLWIILFILLTLFLVYTTYRLIKKYTQ